MSETFYPTSRAPQGSVLGPILFILYANDIFYLELCSQIQIFADDIKLFERIDDENAAEALQNDIFLIEKWCKDWKLPLQPRICNVMTYTLKNNPVIYNYKLTEIWKEKVRKKI